MKRRTPKVVVIGLDCLTPQLLFDRWKDELPAFGRLMDEGIWGPLRSVDPPITVPAWTCMMSGYSPVQLGLYGFRHLRTGSYTERYFALSNHVNKPRVWDHLSDSGLTSGLLAVPQTYPPRKLAGFMVSGFLAPDTDCVYTYPDPLRDEIEDVVGDYMLDVDNFRSDDRDRILSDVRAMTGQRFKLFRHFIRTRGEDFMMMVEIGPDRMHHAFWRFFDHVHPRYEPDTPFADAVLGYYRLLDQELEQTLDFLDDGCHLFVVSDHGAQAMQGGFCINDWLIQRGLLTLLAPSGKPARFDEEMVDWTRTRAWGWGGYYGRVFVNLQYREPRGQVPADSYESFASELARAIEQVRRPDGTLLGNRVLRPPDLADDGEPAGDWPDLMVYPGDLAWRSVGTVGNSGFFTAENDTGPDDANHDHHGIFIYRGPACPSGAGRRSGLRLLDVGPTILSLFGLPAPAGAAGQPMELG